VLERVVTPHCHAQMMVLEAALMGDRELALQALMLDPLCAHLSPSQVRAMGAELLAATSDWLPQFE
jgi:alpha-galactosidase/6-phospho-beta-glucosidase family protein